MRAPDIYARCDVCDEECNCHPPDEHHQQPKEIGG